MQGFVVASIPISVIFSYNVMSGRVEYNIQFTCDFLREQVLNEIQIISGFIPSLARNLRSYQNETHSSYSKLGTMVAPKLFLAYLSSSISEISYIGSDGLFLSYYKEGNQTLTMNSNTSYIESNPNAVGWTLLLICFLMFQNYSRGLGHLLDRLEIHLKCLKFLILIMFMLIQLLQVQLQFCMVLLEQIASKIFTLF